MDDMYHNNIGQSFVEDSSEEDSETDYVPYYDNTDINELPEIVKRGDIIALKAVLENASEEEKKDALNNLDSKQFLPLHYAIRQGDLNAMKLLLQHGTNPNLENYKVFLEFSLEYNTSLGLGADAHNKLSGEMVQLLLDYGADPMQCPQSREIPLYGAINANNCYVIYHLLNHIKVGENIKNKQVSFINSSGNTPLHRLLGNFIEPFESDEDSKDIYDSKRCLYALLLSGIDVKGILLTLRFNQAERDNIHDLIIKAEAFIEEMRKEFGFFGEAVVHQCVLSYEKEREAFKREKFWVRWSAFERNKKIILAEDNKKGKELPAELAILVCKNLAPKSIHFFQTNRSNDKTLFVDETSDVSRLTL